MEVHNDSPIVDVGLLIADRLCVPLTPPLRLYSQGHSLSNDKRVKYYCLGDQSRLGVYGGLLGGSNENSNIIFEMENDLHSSFGTGVTQDIMDTHHEEDLNADQLLQLPVNCADNKKEMVAARKRQNSKARYEAMKMLPNARELMNASIEKKRNKRKANTIFDLDNDLSASICSDTITEVSAEPIKKIRKARQDLLSPEKKEQIKKIRKARQDALSLEKKDEINKKRMVRYYALSPAQKEQINKNRKARQDALSPETKAQINYNRKVRHDALSPTSTFFDLGDGNDARGAIDLVSEQWTQEMVDVGVG
jgi:hypothetical protein